MTGPRLITRRPAASVVPLDRRPPPTAHPAAHAAAAAAYDSGHAHGRAQCATIVRRHIGWRELARSPTPAPRGRRPSQPDRGSRDED